MKKYRVCWVVLCFNEIDVLPFVSKYWEKVADKVVVFDNNCSTDGSIEYLEKLPYVELRHFDSDGHDDILHKQIKENAYREFKDEFDVVIISDLDEVFYFDDFNALVGKMIDGGYNCTICPIYALCEDSKPLYRDDMLLHHQCHKFFKQRMNHERGFDDYSKVSIFNCRVTSDIVMSVGQHYVYTRPGMNILLTDQAFCLHINRGFGADYYASTRVKMGKNLSKSNIMHGMGVEYLKGYDVLRNIYLENQSKSFDINKNFCF